MLLDLLIEANLGRFGGNVIPVLTGGARHKRYAKRETDKRLRAEIREAAEQLALIEVQGMARAEKARALHELDIRIAAATRDAIPRLRALPSGTQAQQYAQQAVEQWLYDMHRRRKDDEAITVLLLH